MKDFSRKKHTHTHTQSEYKSSVNWKEKKDSHH